MYGLSKESPFVSTASGVFWPSPSTWGSAAWAAASAFSRFLRALLDSPAGAGLLMVSTDILEMVKRRFQIGKEEIKHVA